MRAGVAAVLFDLDGTLIDSAPDLASATNALLAERGLSGVSPDLLRPYSGSGARGMLAVALGLTPDHADFPALRDAFYRHYAAHLNRQTRLFDEVLALLDALDGHGLPWGIVTNKALRFAQANLQVLDLHLRARTLVAGDSTPHTKPHPEPLLEAARRLGFAPGQCVYVGDDLRDMQAGRAAGMRTLAAAWGYLGPLASPHEWAADAVLSLPKDLLNWLEVP